jgi:SAM-dependent methyltransferase
MADDAKTPEEVVAFYSRGLERTRLRQGRARLERARIRSIIAMRLPPPPAAILDVGGGSGVHATWLARRGYDVTLVDPVPLHVEQATAASAAQGDAPLAGVELGDARDLSFAGGSFDCVLLFGPLYHLVERSDRLAALAETRRVIRPGGLLFAIAISRYAWLLDGLASGRVFTRPGRLELAASTVDAGVLADPELFTTAALHRPGELEREIRESGFALEELLGVEGPGWLLEDFDGSWSDTERRAKLLAIAELVEAERDLVAASTHLLAVARA